MSDPIKVGGPYKESDSHVPNPTDMVAQYNTEGVGAHGRIEEVSPVFEVDKVKTSQEILGALDPDDDTVSSDRVLLPDTNVGNDAAKESIVKAAEARVDKGVVVGGPTPAEREAEAEGEEGEQAAVEQERQNAESNSTGNRSAGEHDSGQQVEGQTPSGETQQGDEGEKQQGAQKSSSSSSTAKKTAAKKS